MNTLFPVFLKADQLRFLIAGSGATALEKYHTLRKNSLKSFITVFGVDDSSWMELVSSDNNLLFKKTNPLNEDHFPFDVVIAATRDHSFNAALRIFCKQKRILFNAADMPDLCDFYLASTLQKGNLKVAISTNGLSPALGIQLKSMLDECLPDDLDHIAEELNRIRYELKQKLNDPKEKLKEITSALF